MGFTGLDGLPGKPMVNWGDPHRKGPASTFTLPHSAQSKVFQNIAIDSTDLWGGKTSKSDDVDP